MYMQLMATLTKKDNYVCIQYTHRIFVLLKAKTVDEVYQGVIHSWKSDLFRLSLSNIYLSTSPILECQSVCYP